MTSFTDIPYADIIILLHEYNQPIPLEKIQGYKNAWKLIVNGKISEVPESVADFLISLNLDKKIFIQYIKNNFPTGIRLDQIILTSENNLIELSSKLTLSPINKERIIRILSYLGILKQEASIFDVLPNDTIRLIALELDCRDIKLACKLSNNLSNYCQNGGYKSMLTEKLSSPNALDVSTYDKK